MTLILCIDDRLGLTFNGRRQSQDEVLRERILHLAEGKKLWMTPYSAKQFSPNDGICISDDPENAAGEDDFYFAEDAPFDPNKASGVVLYLWNRHYPSDRVLEIHPKDLGMKRISKKDFVGSSHKKITEEIYSQK